MALLRYAATVGVYTMASRVLGFLRDILIALFLGASGPGDVFFIAFKLPNLFRRLFAEGAFNLAFVPIFAGLLKTKGHDAARHFAADALSVLLVGLVVLVATAQLAMPWLMHVFAPGFAADPAKFDLAIQLTRITFPYLLFISLVSLMGGLLNSMNRFAAPAATPILLNLCLIAALLGVSILGEGILGEGILGEGGARLSATALAWGVFAAGIVQFLWMAWHCARIGILPGLPWPRLTPGVKQLLLLMLPAALGAGVYQINLMVDMIIASLLPGGSVSFLYYADRVVQLPLGVIGVAIATALLPSLSRDVRDGGKDIALASQNRALEAALLLTLPAAAALMVVALPIISVLFERGAFGPGDSASSAWALVAFASGLPAYVLIKVLAPGYFARHDTRMPLYFAAVCLVVNVVLNLLLMGPLLHVGIALASALSSWLNAGLLAFGLFRRGHLRPDARLRQKLPRMVLATALMALALFLAQPLFAPWLAGGLGVRVLALILMVAGGVLVFALAAQITGAARLKEMRGMLGR